MAHLLGSDYSSPPWYSAVRLYIWYELRHFHVLMIIHAAASPQITDPGRLASVTNKSYIMLPDALVPDALVKIQWPCDNTQLVNRTILQQ